MPNTPDQPVRHAITVTKDGFSHMGYYLVEGEMITVYYAGRSKMTQIGGSLPAALARTMLLELAN